VLLHNMLVNRSSSSSTGWTAVPSFCAQCQAKHPTWCSCHGSASTHSCRNRSININTGQPPLSCLKRLPCLLAWAAHMSAPLIVLCTLTAMTSLCLQPEGEGKYEWSDGSCYEGGWKVRAAAADQASTPCAPPTPCTALSMCLCVRRGAKQAHTQPLSCLCSPACNR
jgi:hypothetical protein